MAFNSESRSGPSNGNGQNAVIQNPKGASKAEGRPSDWPENIALGWSPASRTAMLQGAVGGLIGSLVFIAVLVLAALQKGRLAWAGLNVLGAFWARWLQIADRGALDLFYWDASLGGLLSTLMLGTLLGAFLGSMLTRMPDDYPLAWGVIAVLILAVLVRKVLAPALSPILVEFLEPRVFYAAFGLAGAAAGLWQGWVRGRMRPPSESAIGQ